jgi:cytochrome c1
MRVTIVAAWVARQVASGGRSCYIEAMTTKTETKDKRRRTTMVPVTTMEEIPVLGEDEQAALLTYLKTAEARVKAGKAIAYDPKTFKKRLVGIYRSAKR